MPLIIHMKKHLEIYFPSNHHVVTMCLFRRRKCCTGNLHRAMFGRLLSKKKLPKKSKVSMACHLTSEIRNVQYAIQVQHCTMHIHAFLSVVNHSCYVQRQCYSPAFVRIRSKIGCEIVFVWIHGKNRIITSKKIFHRDLKGIWTTNNESILGTLGVNFSNLHAILMSCSSCTGHF